MKEKKHIDQLFKESLASYEAMPPPEVWSKIEAKLKKDKEDRKVIPLWWKLGGIAALIAFLFSLGTFIYSPSESQIPILVETEQPIKVENNNKTLTDPSDDIITKQIVEADKNNTSITEAENESIEEKVTPSVVANTSNSKEKTKNNNFLKTKTLQNKEAIAVTKSVSSKEKNNSINNKSNVEIIKSNSEVAIINKNSTQENNTESSFEKNEKESIITNNSDVNNQTSEAITATKEVENIDNTTPEEKKSIFEAIEEEKESAIIASEKVNNTFWEVSPNVGPVYYNTLNGGSSIDPSFADNSQSGDVNISYGVQISYNLNDKFSLRTGSNNVNLGYNTGGIEIVSGPEAFGLQSVDYENPGRNVVSAFDLGTVRSNSNSNNDAFAQLNLKSTSTEAEIQQNISYFEIPMEAKYALVNKRVGINMIGGFSTLLLCNNEIVVSDGATRNVLGEANNLNNVSFTSNIGLGFDYKFSKKLKFNIEPMFRYQLNPYSNTSVDFRPYFFGVFSGFSFKF